MALARARGFSLAVLAVLWGGCALAAPFDAQQGDGGIGRRTFDDRIADGDGWPPDDDPDESTLDAGADPDSAGEDAGPEEPDTVDICDGFCDRYVECRPDEAHIICFAACLCVVDQIIRPDALTPTLVCLDNSTCETPDPLGTCATAVAAQIEPTANARDRETECRTREQECAIDLPCEVLLVVEEAAVNALDPCLDQPDCADVRDCAKNALLNVCE